MPTVFPSSEKAVDIVGSFSPILLYFVHTRGSPGPVLCMERGSLVQRRARQVVTSGSWPWPRLSAFLSLCPLSLQGDCPLPPLGC